MVTCIGHSGFLYEGGDVNLIFDYYVDEAHAIKKELFDKKTYVFASHAHSDHYNKKIAEWENYGNVFYILDSGISAFSKNCTLLREGDVVTPEEGIEIRAFGSTDIGISFLVKLNGVTLYHAGDLNDWHWDGEMNESELDAMERAFKEKVDQMTGIPVDVAFFPVDARLGPHASRGVRYFAERIHPDVIIPMHFFGGTAQLKEAERALSNSGCRFVCDALPGDVITL